MPACRCAAAIGIASESRHLRIVEDDCGQRNGAEDDLEALDRTSIFSSPTRNSFGAARQRNASAIGAPEGLFVFHISRDPDSPLSGAPILQSRMLPCRPRWLRSVLSSSCSTMSVAARCRVGAPPRTPAPGAYDSATIRPLTSSLHRRRRPAPTWISTRPRGSEASTISSTIYANRTVCDGLYLAGQLAFCKVGPENR
jgi:hypothetical protein